MLFPVPLSGFISISDCFPNESKQLFFLKSKDVTSTVLLYHKNVFLIRCLCVCVCAHFYSAQLFVLPLKHQPSLFNLAAEYSDLIMWANILISPPPLASTAGTSPNTPILTLHTASRSTHTEDCHVLIPPDIMCLSKSSGFIVNQKLMVPPR